MMTDGLTDLTAFPPDLRRRIEIAIRVRDTDGIPKVPGAGGIERRDGVEVQVMHNGVVVEKDCYYGSWMTELITRLHGHHEPQEEVAFHELVEVLRRDTPAPVMIELGAFWGYYSLWLKAAIPSATVVLVEPDPNNLAVGRRNLALNGVTAEVLHAAVGRVGSATMKLECESDGVVRTVPTVTVDQLLRQQQLPRVDLVLCDVQGGELDMLHGAAATIRDGRVRFMVISTHWLEEKPLLHQACLALVRETGGHIVAEHSITESCTGDGLIVASFDPRDRDVSVDIPIVRARDSLVGELEWQLARRVGWRGIVQGAAAVLPAPVHRKLRSGALSLMLRRRGFGRQDLLRKELTTSRRPPP